jgi:ribosomal protein L32
MAVPKKKVSVSRRRLRNLNMRMKALKYTQCKNCFNFVPLHRKCSDSEHCYYSTNLINKYNSNFL